TLPVVVDVREAPFHTLRWGAGIGVDPVRQEVRGLAEYTDRNFLGGTRKLTVSARAGWAFVPSVVAVFGNVPGTSPKNAPFFTLTGDFRQPRFLARDLDLNALAEVSSNIEQAYQYLGGRAKLGVTWHPTRDLIIRPTYNFEAYRLWGV